MTLPRLALAVIGDEIGPSLDEMISFCPRNDVHRLDMRTVDGRNLLGMTLDEVDDDQPNAGKGRHRGADLRLAGAEMAGARQGAGRRQGRFRLRSRALPGRRSAGPCLRDRDRAGRAAHPRLQPSALSAASGRPISRRRSIAADRPRRAPRHLVEIENEPVCNIGSVAELAAFFAPPAGAAAAPAAAGRYRQRLVDRRCRRPTRHRLAGAARRPDPSQGPRSRRQPHRAAGRRRRAVGDELKRLLGGVDGPTKCWPASRPIARRTAAMPQRDRSLPCAASPARSAWRSSRSRRCARFSFVTVDVFTDRRFGGNPLAVFPDAERPDRRRNAVARRRVQSQRDDLRAAAGRYGEHRARAHLQPHEPRCRSPAIPMSAPAGCWPARPRPRRRAALRGDRRPGRGRRSRDGGSPRRHHRRAAAAVARRRNAGRPAGGLCRPRRERRRRDGASAGRRRRSAIPSSSPRSRARP